MSIAAAPASAEVDFNDCYGEFLEVRMPSRIEEGVEVETETFALPYPRAWLVSVKNKGPLYEQPCLGEPLDTSLIWGGFIEPMLGHGRVTIPDIDGVAFRTIRLSSPITRYAEQSEKFWHDTITSDGILTEDGFVRRLPTNMNAVDGSWLYPETYLSPIGTRVRMGCAADCEVIYRIRPNLRLRYQILIEDENETPDWIAIDTYVRAMITGWITE